MSKRIVIYGRISTDEQSVTTAEKVFFEQGQQFDSLSEVLTGLKVNDQIVTRGYLGLRDGKKVNVISTDKQPETKTE